MATADQTPLSASECKAQSQVAPDKAINGDVAWPRTPARQRTCSWRRTKNCFGPMPSPWDRLLVRPSQFAAQAVHRHHRPPLATGGLLADKVYASFTSTGSAHGGVEAAILAVNHKFSHCDEKPVRRGNPYGGSHVAAGHAPSDTTLNSAAHLGARVASVIAATKGIRPAA